MPIRPMTCLYACFGGWALFLLWAVVLFANHDPSLPFTLTAAIVSALMCGTLSTIAWAALERIDRRATERTERLERAIAQATQAAAAPHLVMREREAAGGISAEAFAAVRKLRRRMQVIDRSVRR